MAAGARDCGPSIILSAEGICTIARTAYYDGIAKHWHRVTGFHGGAFKRYTLNDLLFEKIGGIAGKDIIELGAGNGYLMPLVMRRFSGQPPASLTITDQSAALLDIAQGSNPVDGASYLRLDVQDSFPLNEASTDLILSIMLFNELTTSGLQNALNECSRILRPNGQLLAAVPHPAMVRALDKKGVLTDFGRGLAAMPSAEGLHLPVSRRSEAAYREALSGAGFSVSAEDVQPSEKTRREKPGLKSGREAPMGLLLDCRKA